MVAPVGPTYQATWCTAYEKDFVSGLGTWCPLSDRSKDYRVQCLRGYLDGLELRAIRGGIDWGSVKDHALRLLAEAIEQAA